MSILKKAFIRFKNLNPDGFFLFKNPFYLGLFLSSFLLIFAIFSFDGYYFYDDYAYAFYAYQLSQGIYDLNTSDIFAHRLGLLFPLAIVYTLLGISDCSTLLIPVLASLVSIWIFYRFSSQLELKARIFALLFFGFDFYTLFFSNKLYPDVLLTTLSLGIAYFLFNRGKKNRDAFYFSILNLWAFLSKELIVYFLPAYLVFLVLDMLQRKNIPFWLITMCTTVVLIAAYLSLYYVYTGDPFFRFNLIQSQHYIADYSYFDKEISVLLRRITYEPFFMFFNTGLIIPMAGGMAGMIYWFSSAAFPKKLCLNPLAQFLLIWVILAMGMFWFSSTSTHYYNPIGLFPRHILFLLPFWALLSGYFLALSNHRILFLLISAIYFIAAFFVWHVLDLKVMILYLAFAIWALFGLSPLLKNFRISTLFVLLLLHPVYSVLKPTESGYQNEKKIIQEYLQRAEQPTLVFTDDKLLNGHLYYYRFQKPENIDFKDFKDFKRDSLYAQRILFLLNEHSMQYLKSVKYKIPNFVMKERGRWGKITSQGEVALYELKK